MGPTTGRQENRGRGRKFCVACGIAIAVLCAAWLAGLRRVTHAPEGPVVQSAAPAVAAPVLQEISGTFRKNQTITAALVGQGLPTEFVLKLVESAKPIYNLAKVAASRPYWLKITPSGEFHSFRYPVDDEHYLEIRRSGDDLLPTKEAIPYESRIATVSGRIQDSLLSAVSAVGEEERLALDFADIFMWDVDFNTEIQPGDSFRIVVEKKHLNGRFARYGNILAASITNAGRTFSGFRFDDGSGKAGYFGPDGKSLRKSFLKSPIPYARVSSKFSLARRHPILRIVRPHLGVDYAAPTGTPVVAVGNGSVVFAGWSGQGGRAVRVRHANGYETMYLHLSRISVPVGASVTQGQLIGTVGSTGLATGPHLDFRVLRHGQFMNPAKAVFPPSPPVSDSAFAQFAAARDRMKLELDKKAF